MQLLKRLEIFCSIFLNLQTLAVILSQKSVTADYVCNFSNVPNVPCVLTLLEHNCYNNNFFENNLFSTKRFLQFAARSAFLSVQEHQCCCFCLVNNLFKIKHLGDIGDIVSGYQKISPIGDRWEIRKLWLFVSTEIWYSETRINRKYTCTPSYHPEKNQKEREDSILLESKVKNC